jgi:hypothetical protein
MKRLIKNYTTDVPVERTIAEIQTILGQNGARGIALEYDERDRIKDIFFKIRLHEKELPVVSQFDFLKFNLSPYPFLLWFLILSTIVPPTNSHIGGHPRRESDATERF